MIDPRAAVLRQYATAFDSFAEEAQELVGLGRYAEATAASDHAALVLRAFRLEADCPERIYAAQVIPEHPHRDVSNDRGGTR